MDDNSTSGIIDGSFITETDVMTVYESSSSRGFNQVVKVRRQGKWFFLKGLKPEYRNQQSYIELLKKEFELATLLDHPNIVKVLAKEMNPEIGPCIVMEYVDGVTLTNSWPQNLPLPPVKRWWSNWWTPCPTSMASKSSTAT